MAIGDCTVYELRQYTLHPGTRDAFIRLFETELLDSQDAAGMHVLGQFRDLDRPDVFVWLRGFTDMERRRESLTAFYTGPVWRAHAAEANAMMIDSDDVHLLEPTDAEHALAEHIGTRPPLGGTSHGTAEFQLVICPLRPEDTTRYLHRHAGNQFPALQSLHAPNTFPQLPVHEDRHVAVTLTRFDEPPHHVAADELDALATGPVHRLRLTPTPRSALR
jgi:quinol monooxygenase YgiN